eukprot:TRINITY_DN66803_c7_g1_i1.p1 TRINITY_DN66803_c7_g1~~TRINITY_DN66803_c7_g1_i1.p1  ORF type:complete len:512 (-),score=36.28 TRINITY_DN66803_c7_g1_i1:294-1829(-)
MSFITSQSQHTVPCQSSPCDVWNPRTPNQPLPSSFGAPTPTHTANRSYSSQCTIPQHSQHRCGTAVALLMLASLLFCALAASFSLSQPSLLNTKSLVWQRASSEEGDVVVGVHLSSGLDTYVDFSYYSTLLQSGYTNWLSSSTKKSTLLSVIVMAREDNNNKAEVEYVISVSHPIGPNGDTPEVSELITASFSEEVEHAGLLMVSAGPKWSRWCLTSCPTVTITVLLPSASSLSHQRFPPPDTLWVSSDSGVDVTFSSTLLPKPNPANNGHPPTSEFPPEFPGAGNSYPLYYISSVECILNSHGNINWQQDTPTNDLLSMNEMSLPNFNIQLTSSRGHVTATNIVTRGSVQLNTNDGSIQVEGVFIGFGQLSVSASKGEVSISNIGLHFPASQQLRISSFKDVHIGTAYFGSHRFVNWVDDYAAYTPTEDTFLKSLVVDTAHGNVVLKGDDFLGQFNLKASGGHAKLSTNASIMPIHTDVGNATLGTVGFNLPPDAPYIELSGSQVALQLL